MEGLKGWRLRTGQMNLAQATGSTGEQKEQGLWKQRPLLFSSLYTSRPRSLDLWKMKILYPSPRVVVKINSVKLLTEPTTLPDIANTNKW